jgi:hypothetical protein
MKFRERSFPRTPVNKRCRVRRTASYARRRPVLSVGLATSRVSLDRWGFAARLARPWKGRTAPEGAAHFPAQPYRRDSCAN